MKTRLIPLLLLVVAPSLGHACSIPVFRYALERWELSPYELTVYHDRPLTPQLQKMLESLGQVNLTVTRVDLTGKWSQIWWLPQRSQKPLPWLSARLPDSSAKLPDAWTGQLTEENLRRLLDSPARRQLVKHLSEGTTAVFILLPGNDAAANLKATELLDKELARLAKLVELPAPSAEGPQIRSGVPLKIEFATLRLDRKDPAEQAFVQTLLHSEEDLSKVRGPIVLPVFGRGRLLCSLFGEDLNRDQLANVVRFLCGECSCQVKELNPGVDLLITADWPALLEKAGPPMVSNAPKQPATASNDETPPPIQIASAASPTPIAANDNVVVPPSYSSPPVAESDCCVSDCSTSPCVLLAVGGAGLLVLVTGIWVLVHKK